MVDDRLGGKAPPKDYEKWDTSEYVSGRRLFDAVLRRLYGQGMLSWWRVNEYTREMWVEASRGLGEPDLSGLERAAEAVSQYRLVDELIDRQKELFTPGEIAQALAEYRQKQKRSL